jgi:hypothetical protein
MSGQGGGSGQVKYRVSDNNGSWRGATISVGGRAFTIYQNSPDTSCFVQFFGLLSGPSNPTPVDLSRAFRDKVLAQTPRGRRYTEMYYRFSGEAIQAVLFEPKFLWLTRDLLERYQPLLKSMVDGKEATIYEQDLAELDSFLRSFAAKASPELAKAIQEFRQDLRNPSVHREFGVTLKERQDERRIQR